MYLVYQLGVSIPRADIIITEHLFDVSSISYITTIVNRNFKPVRIFVLYRRRSITMGLRFRKSIKLGGGARLNIGKKSVGLSVGGKGARYTVSSSGRQ